MTRWTAPSDLDYFDEPWRAEVEWTCRRCGESFTAPKADGYHAYPVCAGCYRTMLETQQRKGPERVAS